MKHSIIFLISLSISCITFAQNKLLTVKDVEVGARREFYPTNMQNLQWQGKSSNFTYQDYNTIYLQSVTNANAVTLITLEEINAAFKKNKLDTLVNIPYITWENENEFHFFAENNWYAIKMPEKQVIASIKFPEEAANFKLFYSKKLAAYTLKNNVFVIGTNNTSKAITNDLNIDIVNGDIVSRNEFGINDGIFWSPEGNYIAFYRKDNSKVKNYPLVDITAREAELKNIKYPMAGMASEHISLGVYTVSTNSSVFIEKDDTISEKYLTNITWSPDESGIYIQVLNRLQNHMKLNRYNISDGSLAKTLFEEQNDKYMEPLNPLLFLNKTPGQFIYQSRRDGFNHAYLYTTEGTLVSQLTSGNFEITDILLFDSNDNLFYTSTEESPIEQHAYKLNTKTGQKAKLTRDAGSHRVIVNQNSKYCIDTYSSILVPRVINIISATGKIERNMLTAQNPLKNYNMPEMKIGTLKAADGKTDLYYRLIKPIDFDSNKKYPAIIYVYGGPHTQLVTNSWLGGARLWDHMMAQKGYVVITVDSRGSSNRGLEFENIIHRQCGVVEMQDQLEGVKLLKQSGYVDMGRVGVHGWSYGGFMTLTMMVNNPGMFKTGVAGGPVTDWKYYEVMYGERYMDMPTENPVGYEKTSLLTQAKNLKGKLLIIHGAVDPTVVWQNSLDFIQECVKNQVPVDYFVYPLSEHNVRGYDRIHLMGKITDYFEDHLK